jgi:hypothetical protein
MSASNPQLIGTGITNAVWGISSVAYAGFCSGITLKRDGEEAKIFDGNGFTIGLILYDDRDEATVELEMQTTDTEPTRGTLVTVAAQVGFICQTIGKKYEWRGMATWNFTATRFVNLVTGS